MNTKAKMNIRAIILSLMVLFFATALIIQTGVMLDRVEKETQQIIESGGSSVDISGPGMGAVFAMIAILPIYFLLFDCAFTLTADVLKHGKNTLKVRKGRLFFTMLELLAGVVLLLWYTVLAPSALSGTQKDLLLLSLYTLGFFSSIAKHFLGIWAWVRERFREGSRKKLQKELQAE